MLARWLGGAQLIALDYRVRPVPRYGHGRAPHAALLRLIEAHRAQYRATVDGWSAFDDNFRAIELRAGDDAAAPYWLNPWLPALDAAALYWFLATMRPSRYVEIGSGQSTRFARRAISDHGLPTLITSIDPHPRAEIDAICDQVIRAGFEDADLSVFTALKAGDIVFFDGSHRSFTNSDVTVFFLDVLPRLARGVVVQIHDIYLPDDYPAALSERYYSEQYLLAAHLLASRGAAATVLLPNAFIAGDAEFDGVLRRLWKKPGLEELEPWGASFWFRVEDEPAISG